MANVYVRSGAGGAGTGADWANAYTTLAAAFAAKAAGDDFWIAGDHAETQASAMTLTSPGTAAAPCRVICVDHAGTVPPVSADLRTTATITTTGNFGMTLAGFAYYRGITFNSGTGAGSNSINLGASAAMALYFDQCKLSLICTGTSAYIHTSGTSAVSYEVVFNNTTVRFSNVQQGIISSAGKFTWKNTASAVDSAGSAPTELWVTTTVRRMDILVEGVDLSFITTGKFLVGAITGGAKMLFKDCKIDSAVTRSKTPINQAADISFVNVAGSGVNYQHSRYAYEGTRDVSTTVKRTGGASDGTQGQSWRMVTNANPEWIAPYADAPIAKWNSTTGSTVTVTIEGVGDPRAFSALPKNDEFWIDCEYLGDASSGLGSFKSGSKADALAAGAALTASTQAWDTGATARANSTAYSLGDVIKLASNPGRIFICTTAGTSNGSEPAGYASAVDGGSVTDNTAVFKAGWRFKQTVTLSSPAPAQAGPIYVYPKMAIASATVYLDPYITLA